MKNVKLLSLKFDNKWTSAEMNEVEVEIGTKHTDAQKYVLPATDELGARLFEVLMPDITEAVSALFDTLTGAEEEEVEEVEEKEPYLSVDEDDD